MNEKKILIVDDEERNIKLLKAILMTEGYHTLGVLGGEEAFNALPSFGPDLILLDVMMPGINGFEVCKKIKLHEQTRMIPVVMVTALREKEHRIKAVEAGADDFLSKPVDQTELLLRVKSLLRIKAYHDDLMKSYRDLEKKNEQLRELEKTKEGLTHMIIHDLNSPVMAITGTIQLLLMDKKEIPERQIGFMERCLDSCHDLSEQIQGLLQIHKMEESRVEPVRETTDVDDLIGGLVSQFAPKSQTRGISLSFHVPQDIPHVSIDSQLIKRVIANLITNALRYTPSGGKIEGNVALLPENGHFFVQVRDTGPGLAPEYHEIIFNKFQQIDMKKSGISVGAGGLGLTFCKMAVEAHGGRIWVESDGQNRGCAFCFEIPV